MLATATGTELNGIDFSLKGYHIVIVKPQVSVPTAKAYAGVTPRRPEIPLIDTVLSSEPEKWSEKVVNDFEKNVFAEFSEISDIKKQLYAMGADYAAMSGSGSAVFGLFKECDNLADSLKTVFAGCDIFTALL